VFKTTAEIGKVQKNMREIIKVRELECRGEKYIDVRTFWPDPNGIYKPSKEGICVKPEVAAILCDYLIKTI
jgi:hypothetical protein